MNKLIYILSIVIISIGLAYNVGDVVSVGHQNQEFELCYGAPSNSDGTVRGIFEAFKD